jgi:hypothetical protein
LVYIHIVGIRYLCLLKCVGWQFCKPSNLSSLCVLTQNNQNHKRYVNYNINYTVLLFVWKVASFVEVTDILDTVHCPYLRAHLTSDSDSEQPLLKASPRMILALHLPPKWQTGPFSEKSWFSSRLIVKSVTIQVHLLEKHLKLKRLSYFLLKKFERLLC